DAQPRFSGHRAKAISGAVAREENLMTARDEILSKVKNALGHRDAAQAVSLRTDGAASTSADRATLTPEQSHRTGEQQRAELIGQFEAALLQVGGHFSVASNAQTVCDFVAAIAESVNAKKAVAGHSSWLHELGLTARFIERGMAFISDADCSDKAAF